MHFGQLQMTVPKLTASTGWVEETAPDPPIDETPPSLEEMKKLWGGETAFIQERKCSLPLDVINPEWKMGWLFMPCNRKGADRHLPLRDNTRLTVLENV